MSKYLNAFLLMAIVMFNIASGAVFRTRPSVHEEHPEKCYHAATNAFYSPGQSFDLKDQCVQFSCLEDLSFYGTGCGVIGTSSECEVVPQDLSKPYPKCCPTIRCKPQVNNAQVEDNGIESETD